MPTLRHARTSRSRALARHAALLALCAMAGACASDPATPSAEAAQQKVYRTGSNLPQSERAGDVKTMDAKSLDRPSGGVTSPTTRGGG